MSEVEIRLDGRIEVVVRYIRTRCNSAVYGGGEEESMEHSIFGRVTVVLIDICT